MSGAARAVAATLALLLAAPAAAQLSPVFIGTFATTAPPGFDPAGAVAVTLRLHPQGAGRAEALRRWFPALRVEGARATFVVRGAAVDPAPPLPAQLAPSFYVDFDEPPVQELGAATRKAYGPSPSLADLARAVDDHLATKSLRRLLDPASVAARRREGDCTEHAVLLAALARLFGHPARLVHGLAVVEIGGRWSAVGHAWTEVHDGRGWTLQDATRLPPGRVLYLPLSATDDEGPGYAAASLRSFSPLDVAGVDLAPAEE